MRSTFTATLVNGVWGDPGVYLDLKFQRRAILFDIGDVQSLSTRILLRVSDVFVSHTHMDHFAGFDHLLRVCLGRDTGVRLYGPPPFISQVEHKLAAYTWNLVDRYAVDFVVQAHELHPDGTVKSARFRSRARLFSSPRTRIWPPANPISRPSKPAASPAMPASKRPTLFISQPAIATTKAHTTESSYMPGNLPHSPPRPLPPRPMHSRARSLCRNPTHREAPVLHPAYPH
jgi:hypothetical protein